MAKTKRALLMSALALTLCVSMLIGSTFAWFTDSVTSANNIIKSGNLDIELEYWDGDSWEDVAGKSDILTNTLWEPGVTEVAYLKVKNAGSLALKYQLGINIIKETAGVNQAGAEFKLSDYIQFGVVENVNGESNAYANRDAAVAAVTDAKKISAGYTKADSMLSGKELYLALVVYMPTTVDNAANHNGEDVPEINLGINVLATQYTHEEDSFNNQYDKDAKYPLGKSKALSGSVADYKATVVVPEDAPAYNYDHLLFDDVSYTNENGNVSMKFDMSLADEAGNPIPAASLECPVEIVLPHPFVDVNNLQVLHNGQPVGGVTYDKATRTIRFTTTGFSPFEIKYVDYVDSTFELEYVEKNDQFTITKGMFVGKNPADLDESLKADDSEYIVVDFEKDGATHYVVSERATTKFIAPDSTTEYKGENGTFAVTSNQSGKLWNVISGLQAKEHSTLYLLPGTFNEATAINVYSNMDIIGLGDTGAVKVVKVKGSYSNRHLFNVNGPITGTEHIKVTIQNLTIDSTAKNLNSAGKLYLTDNAAVQSIRLSKVKCYDLIIKDTGFPFYVNGKYDTRGAYLYTQNITITGTSSVVDTANPYKFYYNNLNYGTNGEKLYTTNSGSIQNTVMATNDWDW